MKGKLTKILSANKRTENARKNGRSDIDCDSQFRFLNSSNFFYVQKFSPEPVDYNSSVYGGLR